MMAPQAVDLSDTSRVCCAILIKGHAGVLVAAGENNGASSSAYPLAVLGVDPNDAPADKLETKRSIVRELAAARRENQEVHGGGTPSLLTPIEAPTSVVIATTGEHTSQETVSVTVELIPGSFESRCPYGPELD